MIRNMAQRRLDTRPGTQRPCKRKQKVRQLVFKLPQAPPTRTLKCVRRSKKDNGSNTRRDDKTAGYHIDSESQDTAQKKTCRPHLCGIKKQEHFAQIFTRLSLESTLIACESPSCPPLGKPESDC